MTDSLASEITSVMDGCSVRTSMSSEGCRLHRRQMDSGGDPSPMVTLLEDANGMVQVLHCESGHAIACEGPFLDG
jgi:hypothetical protein